MTQILNSFMRYVTKLQPRIMQFNYQAQLDMFFNLLQVHCMKD